MFVIESKEKEVSSVRSWYGEPQHEEGDGNGWERAYYGGSNEESQGDPLEFVPEVEHPGAFHEDESPRPSDRPARPLPASD